MMKNMMDRMKMKPKDIKELVEQEPRVHKVRIVCFSVLMAATAGYYRYWFDGLVARSAQMQMRALAGDSTLPWDTDFVHPDSFNVWTLRKTYEALDRVGFTNAVRISRSDDTTTYTRSYANDTTTYYADPNGDPAIQDYYVQTPSSASMEAYEDARRQKALDDPIGYDADRFEEWKKMRDGTIFYDTAACM